MGVDIQSLLGESADDLLGHQSKGIPADDLHLPGPDFVDWITAIQEWVEDDKAPERLTATKLNQGAVEMQRPVCAFPSRAVYNGTGDAKREDSFECANP